MEELQELISKETEGLAALEADLDSIRLEVAKELGTSDVKDEDRESFKMNCVGSFNLGSLDALLRVLRQTCAVGDPRAWEIFCDIFPNQPKLPALLRVLFLEPTHVWEAASCYVCLLTAAAVLSRGHTLGNNLYSALFFREIFNNLKKWAAIDTEAEAETKTGAGHVGPLPLLRDLISLFKNVGRAWTVGAQQCLPQLGKGDTMMHMIEVLANLTRSKACNDDTVESCYILLSVLVKMNPGLLKKPREKPAPVLQVGRVRHAEDIGRRRKSGGPTHIQIENHPEDVLSQEEQQRDQAENAKSHLDTVKHVLRSMLSSLLMVDKVAASGPLSKSLRQVRARALQFVRDIMKAVPVGTCVIALLEHMCMKVTNRTDYRDKTAQAILTLLGEMPEADRERFFKFVLLFSRNGKATLRVFATDLALRILLQFGERAMVELLIHRCSDASAQVRAHALTNLSSAIADPKLHAVFTEMFFSGTSSSVPLPDVNDSVLNITAFESPVAAAPNILINSPLGSSSKEWRKMFRRRAVDDKPIVRKAVLKVYRALFTLPGVSARECIEDLGVFEDCARDMTLGLRKQAIAALSCLLEAHPRCPAIQHAWLESVLPLVMDNESTVVDRTLTAVHDVILKEIVASRNDRTSSSSTPQRSAAKRQRRSSSASPSLSHSTAEDDVAMAVTPSRGGGGGGGEGEDDATSNDRPVWRLVQLLNSEQARYLQRATLILACRHSLPDGLAGALHARIDSGAPQGRAAAFMILAETAAHMPWTVSAPKTVAYFHDLKTAVDAGDYALEMSLVHALHAVGSVAAYMSNDIVAVVKRELIEGIETFCYPPQLIQGAMRAVMHLSNPPPRRRPQAHQASVTTSRRGRGSANNSLRRHPTTPASRTTTRSADDDNDEDRAPHDDDPSADWDGPDSSQQNHNSQNHNTESQSSQGLGRGRKRPRERVVADSESMPPPASVPPSSSSQSSHSHHDPPSHPVIGEEMQRLCSSLIAKCDHFFAPIISGRSIFTGGGAPLPNDPHSNIVSHLFVLGECAALVPSNLIPSRLVTAVQALVAKTVFLASSSDRNNTNSSQQAPMVLSQQSTTTTTTEHQPLSQPLFSSQMSSSSQSHSLSQSSAHQTFASIQAPVPSVVRAHAFVSLGKMCLESQALAKKCMALFIGEMVESDSPVVRNNILVIVADLCKRYTALVDPHIIRLSNCLRDESELVRRHALVLLTHLLQEEFIKWKGELLFRFLLTLVDPSDEVQSFAKYCLFTVLRLHSPAIFFLHFVASIYVLNGLRYHKTFGQFPEAEQCAMPGAENHLRRMSIYKMMLEMFTDEQKLITTNRLCCDVLATVSELSIPLDETSGRGVVADALAVLSCKEIKLAVKTAEEDEIIVGVAPAAQVAEERINAAKGRMLQQIDKKATAKTIVPILIELKHFLENRHSPLLRNLLFYIRDLMRAHRADINELLENDKQLAKEIEFDLRQFEEREKLHATDLSRRRSAAAAGPGVARGVRPTVGVVVVGAPTTTATPAAGPAVVAATTTGGPPTTGGGGAEMSVPRLRARRNAAPHEGARARKALGFSRERTHKRIEDERAQNRMDDSMDDSS
eukprot:gnl/Spiro4/12461_TR6578_c0_g1_i1.p1 gnl/Spiro4/12461_TR6578_c0_g1~~gnl/Spiro4/12461_TR6578_c0_g1_i1.p1  ORF type:complete len:1589 (-),score=422.90 gnl/Spiro4/12461_TR6578_c0_g1_i1:11-4777(-)